MSETVSQVQLAALLDVTTKTVRSWVRMGMPVHSVPRKKGEAAQYVVADVVRWREDQARLAASGDLAAMDLEEAKRRKLVAEAARAEIDLDIARGKVVEISHVDSVVGPAYAKCRARLMSVGAKTAPIVFVAADVAAVKEIIDDSINEALSEISALEFGDGSEDPPSEADDADPVDEDDAAAETVA